MMRVNTYLFFDGNCEAAFKFYERVLGGKIETMMPHAGSPAESSVPSAWASKILHAHMTIGGTVLMASDAPPAHSPGKPQGFAVSLEVATAAEADRVFAELSRGGKVTMPIAETFFAKRFGMCSDQFGIPWMVNCTEGR